MNNWDELKEWLQRTSYCIEKTIKLLTKETSLKDVIRNKKLKLRYYNSILDKMQEIESGKNE